MPATFSFSQQADRGQLMAYLANRFPGCGAAKGQGAGKLKPEFQAEAFMCPYRNYGGELVGMYRTRILAGGHGSKHRILATCDQCGFECGFSRMIQHWGTKACKSRAAKGTK